MFKMNDVLKKKITDLPKLPGCYKYINEQSEIIYVGKAINLSNRVKSYFLNYERLEPHTQSLIENIFDIEYIVVDTEVEALILETNLIKKYNPKYNRALKDDKNYNWIKFTIDEDFPRVKFVRIKKDDNCEYFGPFPSKFPAKEVLKRLRRVFNFRSCDRNMSQIDSGKVICADPKPCLYFHLGLCKAPCASYIDKAEYRKQIYNIIRFFRGQKEDILNDIVNEMEIASKNLQFERASVYRDRIENIKYVLARLKIGEDVDDVLLLGMKDRLQKENINEIYNSIISRQDILPECLINTQKNIINNCWKIECYDVSNIQGTNAVGAMTVIVAGELRTDLYRKFKINSLNTPDDFAMHQEMLTRRLANFIDRDVNYDESFAVLPDLLIIDGGKPQLTSDFEVLEKFDLHNKVAICALAKKDEEIFFLNPKYDKNIESGINNEKFVRIKLSKRSETLKLFQRIRDESHRFGINYHRKLRSKRILK